MLTITLTYRNRDLTIVKRCFESLMNQTDSDFKVVLINYGSDAAFSDPLKHLLKDYKFIDYIDVLVEGQLWNKSRAVNIALRQCKTPLFCVADIDLLFHPEFVSKAKMVSQNHKGTYFQTGFLDQKNTKATVTFHDFKPSHLGTHEVTGITLFNTEILKSINGYDEFYHGWGAEDTDVHLRLKNAGYQVHFYDKDILVKHQWHPKTYRSKQSKAPFHTKLEQINHRYMVLNNEAGVSVANTKFDSGKLPNKAQVSALHNLEKIFRLTNEQRQIDAFLNGVFPQLKTAARIVIKEDKCAKTLKNKLKRLLGKKHVEVYAMETVNNRLLEGIIVHHRLAMYNYKMDWKQNIIELTITS